MTRRSKEFVPRPLSPELDAVHGTPHPRRVNEAAGELLDQLGGTEAVKSNHKIDVQMDAERNLTRLGKRKLAREVTLPETMEQAPSQAADILTWLNRDFTTALDTEMKARMGVQYTKEALAAILGDAQWLIRIADDCRQYVELGQDHDAKTLLTVLDIAEADSSLAKAA